jgi:hypothetical protein
MPRSCIRPEWPRGREPKAAPDGTLGWSEQNPAQVPRGSATIRGGDTNHSGRGAALGFPWGAGECRPRPLSGRRTLRNYGDGTICACTLASGGWRRGGRTTRGFGAQTIHSPESSSSPAFDSQSRIAPSSIVVKRSFIAQQRSSPNLGNGRPPSESGRPGRMRKRTDCLGGGLAGRASISRLPCVAKSARLRRVDWLRSQRALENARAPPGGQSAGWPAPRGPACL